MGNRHGGHDGRDDHRRHDGPDPGMIMEMMRGMGGNPLDMWTNVLRDIVEMEIQRRVEERVRDVCPAAAEKFGRHDSHREETEHLWNEFSDDMGTMRAMSHDGWARCFRSVVPSIDEKDIHEGWQYAD